jgi:hypothetical protein
VRYSDWAIFYYYYDFESRLLRTGEKCLR